MHLLEVSSSTYIQAHFEAQVMQQLELKRYFNGFLEGRSLSWRRVLSPCRVLTALAIPTS